MIYPSTALYPSETVYPEPGPIPPPVTIPSDENMIVYVPQFTFEDDVVTFPLKFVDSSDQLTFSEFIQLDPSDQFDDALLSENFILNASFDLTEQILLSDTFLSLEVFPEPDSATLFEENLPIGIFGPSDHFSFSDFVSISANVEDSGTLEEKTDLTLEASDSAALYENVDNIFVDNVYDYHFLAVEDATNVVDLASFDIVDKEYGEISKFAELEPPDYDPYYLIDRLLISASVPSLDDSTLLSEDVPSVELFNEDSSLLDEQTPNILLDGVALTDYFNLVENNFIITNIETEDQFIYQEVIELIAEYSSSDSVSLISESELDVNVNQTDQITLFESVRSSLNNQDSAQLTEAVSILVIAADSSNLTEKPIIGLNRTDEALISDISQIGALLSRNDTGFLTERDKSVLLGAQDRPILLENVFYHADYFRIDYAFLIGEDAFASILKEDFDYFSVTESNLSIGPNAFDLIMFKDRSALRIAAPIILNINDEPTIHGTASGESVIISTSGTVPLLL